LMRERKLKNVSFSTLVMKQITWQEEFYTIMITILIVEWMCCRF
jgi:hypothetical protein